MSAISQNPGDDRHWSPGDAVTPAESATLHTREHPPCRPFARAPRPLPLIRRPDDRPIRNTQPGNALFGAAMFVLGAFVGVAGMLLAIRH